MEQLIDNLIDSYYNNHSKRKQRKILKKILEGLSDNSQEVSVLEFLENICNEDLDSWETLAITDKLTRIKSSLFNDIIAKLITYKENEARAEGIIKIGNTFSSEYLPIFKEIFECDFDRETNLLLIFYIVSLLPISERNKFIEEKVIHLSAYEKEGAIRALYNLKENEAIEILNNFFIKDDSRKIRNIAKDKLAEYYERAMKDS